LATIPGIIWTSITVRGDFDCILAVTPYRRAVDFVGMMVEAHVRDRPSLVVREAAYATEFALKTLLLRAGYSDD
jgi:hypothetical protein